MSKMRKLMAIFLAVVMALALALPALAADVPPKGTLEITNASPDEKYTIYRILDVTTTAEGNGYSYTVTDGFKQFFTDKNVDITNQDVVYNYIKSRMPDNDSEARISFAAELVKYINDCNTDANDNNDISSIGEQTVPPNAEVVRFENLLYGWYLMVPTFANTGTDNAPEGFAVFNIDTVTSVLSVRAKSRYPTPVKTVTDSDEIRQKTNTCAAGDKLTFEVQGQIPNMNGYPTYYLAVHDSLRNMTFDTNGTTQLKIGSRGIDLLPDGAKHEVTITGYDEKIEYKLTVTDNKSIVLEMINLKPLFGKLYTADTDVVFTYQATVNDNAIVGRNGNDNSVYFEYTNDPNAETRSKSKTVKTTSFVLGLEIMKEDNNKQKIAGANFLLEKKTEKATETSSAVYTPIYSTNGKDANGNRITNNSHITFVEDENISNQNYNFTFKGLDAGEYRLTEVEAPPGLVRIVETINFTITADESIDLTNDSRSIEILKLGISAGEKYLASSGTNPTSGMVSMRIKNKTQAELPATGGAGLYIVAGVAIVALLGFGGTAMLKRKVNGGE